MATCHFQHHFLGTKFLLWADHFPLQYLSTAKDPWSHCARQIVEYKNTVSIKGDQNRTADALSCLRFGNEEEQFTQEENIASPMSPFASRRLTKSLYVKRLLDNNHFQGFPGERSCAIGGF